MEAGPAAGQEASTETAPQGGLVGRDAELAELRACLAASREGRGRLVLVCGESGIGKTTLVEELAREAAASGAGAIAWGRAWEAGGAPPYWPWVQVIRALARDAGRERLAADLGAGAPYVARIAPDLHELLPGLREAPALDTEQARFTAWDAVARFLRATAEREPLLVVLEDLHAADLPALLLLEFLERALDAPVLVVGTYREREARRRADAGPLLARLGREARIVLRGLVPGDVSRLVAAQTVGGAAEAGATAAGARTAELGARLHDLTGGNPLFLAELMRLPAAESLLASPGRPARGPLPLPDGVRETIRRRLEPLAPEALEALTLAAVVGVEFRLETLAAAAGGDRAAVLGHLDAAAEEQLVEELPGELGRYRFTHALVRETLYDALPARRRAALHRAVAEALVAKGGEDVYLSELAHHFLHAAPAGDPAPAVEYATRAGERAMAALAWEQAAEQFRGAVRALELLPRADLPRRGALLLAAGQADMRAGRLEAGRAALREAADVARRLDAPELLARATLAQAPPGPSPGPTAEAELADALAEALDRLGEGAAPSGKEAAPAGEAAPPAEERLLLRARLLARLAEACYWTSPAAERRALIDEAIAIAREAGDPATLAAVLHDGHLATWDPDSPDRALPWADEAIALAERLGDAELDLYVRDWRMSLLVELGDLAAADREIDRFAQRAETLRQPRALAHVPIHAAVRAIRAGRFDDAEQALVEAAARTSSVPHDEILPMRIAGPAFVLRLTQRRVAELEPGLREFAGARPDMPAWRCALTSVLRDSGRDAELRAEWEALAREDFAVLPRDNLWLVSMTALAETCFHLGDQDRARVLSRMLEPYAGRNAVSPGGMLFGPVDRYLGLLAATAGDRDTALARLASARAALERMPAPALLAQLALDEARIGGDAGLAAQARERATALGLEGLANEAAALAADGAGAGAAGAGAPAAAPAGAGAAGAAAAGAAASGPAPRLRRRGDLWDVGWAGASFGLRDQKGLSHIAALLAAPGVDLHALELAGGQAERTAGAADPELTVRARGDDDAGPLLDDRAKAEYRRRMEELRADVEEAESFHDPERARRARDELEFLAREVTAAVGLGGRDRRAGSSAERARVNVTRAIKAAIDRLAAEDAALGHHLRASIRTGTFCVYDPGPEPPPWEL